MNEIKTIQELMERVKSNYYKTTVSYPQKPEGYKKENYVYDENQSVKWNREHREELESNYIKELEEYRNASRQRGVEFQFDLANALKNEYGINAEQTRLICNQASESTDGYDELIWEVQGLAELYLKLKELE